MTDTLNEQISAYADGELSLGESQLLRHRLMTDDDLRSTWKRYHLIRDAMREDLPEYQSRSVRLDYNQTPDHAKSVSRRKAGLTAPLAGLGIAASVAALAVFSVLHLSGETRLNSPESLQIAHVVPRVRTETLEQPFHIVPRSGWNVAKSAVVPHLNSYLVDHSSYAGFASAQGIIPYSRVVGFDTPISGEGMIRNDGYIPTAEKF